MTENQLVRRRLIDRLAPSPVPEPIADMSPSPDSDWREPQDSRLAGYGRRISRFAWLKRLEPKQHLIGSQVMAAGLALIIAGAVAYVFFKGYFAGPVLPVPDKRNERVESSGERRQVPRPGSAGVTADAPDSSEAWRHSIEWLTSHEALGLPPIRMVKTVPVKPLTQTR